jgi:hypothetical protein
MSEDNDNYSDEENSVETNEKYLDQNLKESYDSNDEDFDWKPSNRAKKTSNKSKPTTNSSPNRRKHIIYNPPERSVNYRNVTIGNQVFECQIGDDDMFHCEWYENNLVLIIFTFKKFFICLSLIVGLIAIESSPKREI